jgi:predicted neutral ceramidase superfamily lipid hydrolase
MSPESGRFKVSTSGKIVLVSAILVSLFWWLTKTVDIYKNAIVGAIFEILWLPMLALLFILPVISLFFWRKDKFSVQSLFLYSMLIGLTTAIWTIVR